MEMVLLDEILRRVSSCKNYMEERIGVLRDCAPDAELAEQEVLGYLEVLDYLQAVFGEVNERLDGIAQVAHQARGWSRAGKGVGG